MTDEEIKKVIDDTVNTTIAKLKLSGLMKDNGLTAFQKTEQILRAYPKIEKGKSIGASDKQATEKFLAVVDRAVMSLLDDVYYDIIPMIYFEGKTREEVAEYFDSSVTTISRNKTRLVNKLKPLLFSDQVILELFS